MTLRPLFPPAAPDAAPWLIVAVTGRALAASAVRGGYASVVLDFFADRDTRAHAQATRVVALPHALRMDVRALRAAIRELTPAGGWMGVVPGAGFEARPALLDLLAGCAPLYGNPADVVARIKDPARFTSLLDGLGLPHPEVSLAPLADPRGWLEKRTGGAGGVDIRPATRRLPRGAYLQRWCEGRALSATFLANGQRALILGFNQQWTEGTPDRPYLYGGAVSGLQLPATLEAALAGALDALVRATGVVGLGSLDFLQEGNAWWILELNPRPTATMELHDPGFPRGLFHAHLRACAGELPATPPAPSVARAHAIVSAPAPWRVGLGFEFPAWCHDLPMSGTALAPGMPVCTVTAEAPSPEEAAALARARRAGLLAAIHADLGSAVGA